ncbi:hypothetical protein HHK36_030212 [Tetracentron sinense]|uniref:Uncharacterized protein n=1 Tax=Tetracentron sinense TaxID=13715 RepID=A0A834YAU1_TETSI|nr:hypothetical protein HHK36_030212 [Tetracentron sinense]
MLPSSITPLGTIYRKQQHGHRPLSNGIPNFLITRPTTIHLLVYYRLVVPEDTLFTASIRQFFTVPTSATHPPPSALFFQDSNQDFHNEPQFLLHNRPFHGLMQLPNHKNTNNSSSEATATAANLFNLSFFSNSSNTSGIKNNNNPNNNNSHLPSSGMLIPNQFINGNGSSEGTTLFSGNIMGDHMGSGVSSLYNTSVQNGNGNVIPQMSATALLQKASQMGSTTSGNNTSLLRGFSNSSSSGGSGGVNPFGVSSSSGHEQETGFSGLNANRILLEKHHHNRNLCDIDEAKLHQNLTVSMGVSDGLTRDFLGVGGMVTSMDGRFSQREQHQSIEFSSLNSEIKSAAASRSFGSGNLQ